MPATKITKATVEKLEPGEVAFDGGTSAVTGFCARRLPSGKVTFALKYRASGRQRWYGLGQFGTLTVEEARKLARKAAGAVAAGRDPQGDREAARAAAAVKAEAERKTVAWLIDEFLAREAQKLRSAAEICRILDRYVRPRIGARSIYALKRSDVVGMLDEVEDKHGATQSHAVLAWVRRMCTWQAARDDEFRSPIVRGMAKIKPRERARTRTLDDEEIRALWAAAEGLGAYGGLVRFLLATGQRRDEAAGLRWNEIGADDIWLIPVERHKGKVPFTVPLNDLARRILAGRPDKGREKFAFSTRKDAKRPISGFAKFKRKLDSAMVAELNKNAAERGDDPERVKLAPFVVHDLRRTARSLMSRAGVSADHGELATGHAIAGVRGTYDRWHYLGEKTEAMKRLGALLESILKPPPPNVVTLRPASTNARGAK